MDPPERPWKRPRHWLPRPPGSARAPDKGKPKDSGSICEGPDKDKPKDPDSIKEGPETGKPKDLDFSQASVSSGWSCETLRLGQSTTPQRKRKRPHLSSNSGSD